MTGQYHTTSLVANLNDLENFILLDPSTGTMYKQFLATTTPSGRKANHIDFFVDIIRLEELESLLSQRPKSRTGKEKLREELMGVYHRYFEEASPLMLEIKEETIQRVRENLLVNVNVKAFNPAIRVVVRELAFIYFESFLQSPIFKDYKDSPKEKESVRKINHFFGEKLDANTRNRKSLGYQPKHTKEFKLSKRFGERVGVEKTSLLLQDDDEFGMEDEEEEEVQLNARRDRRLHVFFGDYFEVDDVLYSERVRAPEPAAASAPEYQQQPTHVKNYKLARFFGTSPPTRNQQGVYNTMSARDPTYSKTRLLNRFFGERIDPVKESSAVTFASQPMHVRGYKLKQIFGESASHTISFGTWPGNRPKLEKIFGPYND